MLKEYDKIRIQQSRIIGETIDIYYPQNYPHTGEIKYTVESDEKGVPRGRGDKDSWKFFYCSTDELEKISDNAISIFV